ncbi:alkaline phosphatase family protein [Sinomonas notoginsengisoli]|uniref:bifunctional YncE family protein/alkaline phosphatase family protein n=1 Tax=Sinomonas notoginsengisoli TaxID=1457311 RepID=UPI001F1682A4|nr:bifunctional YncE family protein/alkaline phosphatase family protein [Sinomonas notoginsengisoli]
MGKNPSRRRLRRAVAVPAAGIAVALAAGTAIAVANGWGDALIGRQPDGSVLTATNQRITPAGTAVEQSGRPITMAVAPDGKTAVNETWHGKGQFTVTDLVNHKVLQQISPSQGWGSSYGGLLYSPDGKTLWAAQPGNLQKFTVNPDGTLASPVTIPMPSTDGKDPIPSGLAWAPGGQQILATFNGTNTLAVLDGSTGAVIRQIPVGNAPRDVVVLGGHAFVANQGGRPAQPGDTTNDSYGTAIVTDNEDGSPSTGTVSEVDPATGTVVRTYQTGLAPSALLVRGDEVLVANSNSDTISVLDTKTGKVGQTINVNPLPGAPASSSPTSLAMLDGDHLAVSLGQANAVAVYEYEGEGTPASFQGLVPTGWYPGTIAYDKALSQMVVASEKGVGSLGAPGANGGHNVKSDLGTVSTVPVPSGDQLSELTKQVWDNNQWTTALAELKKNPSQAKAAIPRRDGDQSTIKHVFMVVKENRTYDQVLGDDSRGSGDPALAEFGGAVTPNHHALASAAGPLLDNTYSSGTMSADGHQWLTQATVDEYLTRSIGNYDRSYPYNGGDALAYSATGFLWDNAARHGVTAKDWGEYTDNWTDAAGNGDTHTWSQWYQNSQAIEAGKPATIPADQYHASTDVPSLSKILHPQFPGFQLQVPDQYRADLFVNDLRQAEKDDSLPQLNILTLPADHTAGTDPSEPTPSAMVADNDLAVGRIIDAVSHSKYGKDSAVFVMEDDSQGGVDHVDGHRQPALVWSPFAKKGAVVNTYYTQLNIVRTIEQILALPPMTQMDLAAEPMFDAFTDKADTTPYTARPNQIPLDTLNGAAIAAAPAAAQSAAQAWSDWSKKQDWKGPDRVNPAQLNRADWYAAHNYTRPYPGDDKILTPDQVPGAGTSRAPVKSASTDTDD